VRVLLDECLPKKLKRLLAGHEVRTTAERGWAGKKNGDLLTVAQAEFDALLTVDRSLRFQQRVARFDIGVIVLTAPENTLESLQPLVPEVLQALKILKNGQVLQVGE
jgi:predicted nuclease of predicted toxin-antitoxin system